MLTQDKINELRDEWVNETKNDDSKTFHGCWECGREIDENGCFDWWFSHIKTLLKERDEELVEKINGMKIHNTKKIEELCGLRLNEDTIKELVKISCNGRQNIVLEEIII